jgi:hypothetical protein
MSETDDLYAEAHRLQQASRFREAADIYRTLAGTLLTVNIACNLAMCLAAAGELDEAMAWLGKAIAHRPESPVVLSASLTVSGALLAAGRYAEGWPLMEARIPLHPALVAPVKLSFPEWKGEDLAGKSILVLTEQGLGDQIMFIRFAKQLAERGAQVSVTCRPAMASLFAGMGTLHEVIPISAREQMRVGRHDYWSRYVSLPLHLGTTLETLPNAPYLSAPAENLARWQGYPGAARIGVMWRTSPTGSVAGLKTLPDDQARRLLDLGAISLQPEDTGVADFADTAAIVDQLDLVISVDTSVAHLAGALGKPCWTLLPVKSVDWRWMHERADSPWYPSMRLFRHQPGDDWSNVVDRVVAARG